MRSFKKTISVIMAASLAVGVLAVPGTYQAKAEDLSPAPSETPIQTTAVPTGTPVQTPLISAVPATTTGVPVLVSVPPTQHPKVTAEPKATVKPKKAYGDRLKLNNEIKLNRKKMYVKQGRYHTYAYAYKDKNWKTGKVKYTISSKRKSVGNKYKVTYKVKYKLLADPNLIQKKISTDEWYIGISGPQTYYTVFDYQTGKSLERKNKLGVKVKGSKWKEGYYPKRYFEATGELKNWYMKKNPKTWRKILSRKNCWYRNKKSVSYSFTVTYSKECKDVVVGIGFANMTNATLNEEKGYWKGRYPFGQCAYYQYGKKTTSFMRLN